MRLFVVMLTLLALSGAALGCVDDVSICATNVQYCTNTEFKQYMETNCKKTCGKCPQTTCTDDALCIAGWQQYCNDPQYSNFMAKCPLLCGKCPAATCVDKSPTCALPGNSVHCTNPLYQQYMETNCQKTCNKCPAAAGVCEDKIPTSCPGAVNLCTDTTYGSYMTENCAKTCGKCTTPAAQCSWTEKADSYLKDIAGLQTREVSTLAQAKTDCVANQECNGVTCAAAGLGCSLRKAATETASTTGEYSYIKDCTTVPCVDKSGTSLCEAGKANCGVQEYIQFMINNCQKTCNKCPTAASATPPAAPAGQYISNLGMDFALEQYNYGNVKNADIGLASATNYETNDAATCRARCDALTACKSYVWHATNFYVATWQKKCVLKTAVPQASQLTPNIGVDTYQKV